MIIYLLKSFKSYVNWTLIHQSNTFMSQRDTDLKKLVDFGFENDLVEEAYEKYSGDYEKALNFLLEFHSEKDFQKYEKRKGKYLEWDYLKIKSPLFRSGAATCRSKDKFYIFGGVAVSKHLNDLVSRLSITNFSILLTLKPNNGLNYFQILQNLVDQHQESSLHVV